MTKSGQVSTKSWRVRSCRGGRLRSRSGDTAFEEGAAFDGETGFASGEIVAMDGLVVFEKVEEAGSKL